MFCHFGKTILLICFLVLAIKNKGCNGSTVVASPMDLYVPDGSRGIIRCQNRSDNGDTFYSYITDAIWHRYYSNGSNISIVSTGAVYASQHTLNFNPLLTKDEGEYCCCTPSGSCSRVSTVAKAVPPIIQAVTSQYTAEVRSQITLACNITFKGVPTAQFGWLRNGIDMNGDMIFTDNNISTVVLSNVTFEDAGTYTCTARSGRFHRSDTVQLSVSNNTLREADISNADYNWTSGLQLALIIHEPPCQSIKNNLTHYVLRYLQDNYDQNTVQTVEKIECANISTATFELQFTGYIGNETLHRLRSDINNSAQGLNIGIGILKLCELNCTVPSITDPGDEVENNSVDGNQFDETIVIVILAVVIASLFLLIIFTCSLIVIYKRCVKRPKHRTVATTPMHKCNPIYEADEDEHQYSTLNFHNNSRELTSNHQPAGDYLEITSNYVEPNSIDGGVVRCFPLWPCRNNSMSSNNKPTVMKRSDGSGLVIVGTLQAIIPSTSTPNDQEGHRIVPSATHESYVDVVK